MEDFNVQDEIRGDIKDFVETLGEEMENKKEQPLPQGKKKVHFLLIVLMYLTFPVSYFLPLIYGLIVILVPLIFGYHWYFAKDKTGTVAKFNSSAQINGFVLVLLALAAAIFTKYFR